MNAIKFVFSKNAYIDDDVDFTKEDFNVIHKAKHSSLYWLCNTAGIAESHTVDNLPVSSFIYEYHYPWWFNMTTYFNKETGFLQSNPLPKIVEARILQGTAYLAVVIPMESYVSDNALRLIHDYFSETRFPASNIIYFTSSPAGNAYYNLFCKNNNLAPTFTVDYIPYYLGQFGQLAQEDNVEYNIEVKDKTLLMFNRRFAHQAHRALFLYNMQKEKIIDRCYISFLKYEHDNKGTYTDHIRKFEHLVDPIDYNIVAEIEERLPMRLDTSILHDDVVLAENPVIVNLYRSSFFSVVSETYFFSNIIHITEKSFKPMRFKHPFIILATPYFLRYIRQMGFMTFNQIWDESYDDEKDHAKRFRMILNLVKQLDSLSNREKQDVMHKCKEVVDHNYNMLCNWKTTACIVSLLDHYG